MNTFAQRSLPPGDRDDMPTPPQSSADLFDAGREKEAPAHELLPGLELVLADLGPALDNAQAALGELKKARTQGNLALLESAAHRLAGLANNVSRTVKNYQPREN